MSVPTRSVRSSVAKRTRLLDLELADRAEWFEGVVDVVVLVNFVLKVVVHAFDLFHDWRHIGLLRYL